MAATRGDPLVRIEKKGRVTTVIINRPYCKNAVDGPTAAALLAAFEEFDADGGADVAVLYGDGGFCSGADLKAVSKSETDTTTAHTMNPHLRAAGPMGPSRMRLSKPVIAAVEGHAVAGGLELACWCDLRVAEDSAVFGVYCRRWGVPLMDGGTVRLPRLIGLSRALDMIITGRAVSATEAHSFGLVNYLCKDGTARETAEALAQSITKFPQVCLRGDLASAYAQHSLGLQEALALEFGFGAATASTGETVSGATRFASGHGRHGNFDDLGEVERAVIAPLRAKL